MKTEATRFVVEIEDEDEDFLSQVAAAEAQALANKRRRISVPPSPNAVVSLNSRANPKEGSDDRVGGLYTAALKGSQSAAFDPSRGGGFGRGRVNAVATGNDDVSVGGGACFKCGKPGHWARDCDAPGGGGGGGYFSNYGGGDSSFSSISVPEKSCPCGFGACLVLTANTEKNRGRKFYKCPLRQENGGCGFFEWCDNASGPNAMAGGTASVSFSRTQNYASDSSFPALECPCGGGLCLILTAKTGKNIGSQFYRCPAQEGSSCGFFKWCNEHNVAAAGVLGGGVKVQRYGSSEANNSGYDARTGSSCFKCGKEGHWARDCSVPSYNAPVEPVAARSGSPGTCYKCSKPGHWARDCPFS